MRKGKKPKMICDPWRGIHMRPPRPVVYACPDCGWHTQRPGYGYEIKCPVKGCDGVAVDKHFRHLDEESQETGKPWYRIWR